MKDTLLALLACPECRADLQLTAAERADNEIISGHLQCTLCGAQFPIQRGVPRFADLAHDPVQRETAANFGAQWLEFDEVQPYHDKQFRDWIAPVTPAFVKDKLVLEGGCGKGRHTRAIADWGAATVIGIDLSEAVEAAYRNTRDLPNAHIIQADIYRLPLKNNFDYAFSVGVLHHLPDPRRGFLSLVKHLKHGGAMSAWVYGRENNGWIIYLVNPLREHLTARLPMRALYVLSYPLSVFLYAVAKWIYAPLAKSTARRWLFYADYLCYVAQFPFREIHNIVHDHLTAPIAFYISREEFADWFKTAEASDYELAWHNSNSWRGFGIIEPLTTPKASGITEVAHGR